MLQPDFSEARRLTLVIMPNLPNIFGAIPFQRLSYAHPSPIHYLPGLTKHIQDTASQDGPPVVHLWAKRDDQAGPLVCYGNKYRKFEYIIPDILKKADTTTLVTEGAVQSNHNVQVASLARVLNLKCHLLLHQGIGGLRTAVERDAYLRVGNVQINHILGAEVRFTTETDTGDENGPLLPFLDELKSTGEVPYWIPSGASLHPLGGLGYARCAFELAEQEQQMLRDNQMVSGFDVVFIACGSGSSLSGLIAGFRLLQKTSGCSLPRIVGVLTSPTKPMSYHKARILRLARSTGALIGLKPETDLTAAHVHLDDSSVGSGYGILDEKSASTINLAASADSLLLDPVYTAKVMTGLLEWAQTQTVELSQDSGPRQSPINALFIHTGGQNALSAYADVWPSTLSA